MGRTLWIIFGIIGFGLLMLLINHNSGETFGLPNDTFASALYLGVWGAVVAAAVVGSGQRLGEMARNAIIWLMAILVLCTVYVYRFELQEIGTRLAGGLLPGAPISRVSDDGRPEVVLTKGLGGHFQARADINGQSVSMMVDTGASTIALSFRDAERIGLDVESLRFIQPVVTANGRAMAAPVTLPEVSVGDITRHNVRAGVLERGKLAESLLGMSFIETLSSFHMSRDELVLRD
ncbi:TIGR02281 family clan AA aspartic protease [Hoeflea sp. TYP-13]|uniref:TIGR02281 family clan AA aspartic protease n=1 Tax=Hoeflea sp. TYP-13 TaxID=3230023 RepID=UPI0034C6B0AB